MSKPSKARANANAVQYGNRASDNAVMSFTWGVSSGETLIDDEKLRLQAGFNDLYELFGFIEWSHGGSSRVRNVWLNGKMLMPVDVLMQEFDGVCDFEDWLRYAVPAFGAK